MMNNQNPNNPTSVEKQNAQSPTGNPRATGNSAQRVNPNAGQSQGGANNQQRNQADFEQQAKYFQSEKDKAFAEARKAKEELGKVRNLLQRPEVENAIRGALKGEKPKEKEQVNLRPEEYDPWASMTDPKSKSYQFRMQEEQQRINSMVDEKVNNIVGPMQKENAMSQLRNKLSTKYRMSPNEIDGFIQFAETPINELGEDNIVQMYRAYQGQNGVNSPGFENPLDQVRQTQSQPQQSGVLQGQQPLKRNEADSLFDAVLGASAQGRLGLKK
jgi:hypothetical protein